MQIVEQPYLRNILLEGNKTVFCFKFGHHSNHHGWQWMSSLQKKMFHSGTGNGDNLPELLPPASICGFILAWTLLSELIRFLHQFLIGLITLWISSLWRPWEFGSHTTECTLKSYSVILQMSATGYKKRNIKIINKKRLLPLTKKPYSIYWVMVQ